MSVKVYCQWKQIKNLSIDIEFDENGKKMPPNKHIIPKGYQDKSFIQLNALNTRGARENYPYIIHDTSAYHILDIDNQILFDKYFGHLNLLKSPYYPSISKGLPHIFLNITNLPKDHKKSYQVKLFGETEDIVICDILVGNWSYARKEDAMKNGGKDPITIDFNLIKDIMDLVDQDSFKKPIIAKPTKDPIEPKKTKTNNIYKEFRDDLACDIKKIASVKDMLVLSYLSEMPHEMADDNTTWVEVGYIINDYFKDQPDVGLYFYKQFSKLSIKYDDEQITAQYNERKASKGKLSLGTLYHYMRKFDETKYNLLRDIQQAFTYRNDYNDIYLVNKLNKKCKDFLVCAGIRPNPLWFYYEQGIWNKVDGEREVRLEISKLGNYIATLPFKIFDLKAMYETKIWNCNNAVVSAFYKDQIELCDNKDLLKSLNDYTFHCRDSVYIRQICSEARDYFYNKDFLKLLNTNTHLLSFGPHVFDFKVCKWRLTTKDDYISIKTNMTMEQCLNADTTTTIALLNDIFPNKDQYEFMLNMLSDAMYENRKQVMGIFSGVGANGKSLLIKILSEALGPDYLANMDVEYLTSSKKNTAGAANSELVNAVYAKLLICTEPDDSEVLHNGKIKALTGSDEITGRKLYENSITFKPCFTPIILCNSSFKVKNAHEPALNRRLIFSKFTQKFVDGPELKENEKIKKEEYYQKDYLTTFSRGLMRLLLEQYIKLEETIGGTHKYPVPAIMATYKREFINNCDDFMDYFNINYVFKKDEVETEYTKLVDLVSGYNAYLKELGQKSTDKNIVKQKTLNIVGNENFKEVDNIYVIIDKKKSRKMVRNTFRGIRPRNENDDE